MVGITVCAVIYIAAYIIVFVVHPRFIMFMAGYTAEYAEIAAVGMTFVAIAPLSHMGAAVYRKIEFVVIVGGWFPAYNRMTGFTVGRKS